MKILFIAADNWRTSGAMLSMVKLNQLLAQEHGIETLVVLPFEGQGDDLLKKANIDFRLIQSERWSMKENTKRNLAFYGSIIWKKVKNSFAIRKITKLAEEFGADIIHINATDSYVGAIVAKKLGIPCIWHIREFMEEDHHKTLWDRAKNNKLIGESAQVIAISNGIYKKYESICTKNNICLVHNGIDIERHYKPEHEILYTGKVTFIYGGGYNAGKGFEELVYALAETKNSFFSNFEFLVIGDCPEKCKKLLDKLGLSIKTKYLGYQNNVSQHYEKADIAFNCSESEAFGRKTVESMLAGALVIASNTGGTLDIIEHKRTGLLYQQGDPLDLMNKIVYALNHVEEMRKIAAAGRLFAHEHFSASRNAKEIVELYKEVLSKLPHVVKRQK
jgi:glycosyltransferase involved in cell wall biosynthesis